MLFTEVPIGAVALGTNIRSESVPIGELAGSVTEFGILNPVTVRELKPGRYEMVTGKRRLEAARAAGLQTIPACVRSTEETRRILTQLRDEIQRRNLTPLSEARALESRLLLEQVTENVQREDLSPLDLSTALVRYLALTGETQLELGRRLGKNHVWVSQILAIHRGLSPEERETLRAMPRTPGKEVLITAARTRSPKLRAAMLSGEMSAHAAKRAHTLERRRGGKPRNFLLRITTPQAIVTVAFRKPRASQAEVIKALEHARADVSSRKFWPPKS